MGKIDVLIHGGRRRGLRHQVSHQLIREDLNQAGC